MGGQDRINRTCIHPGVHNVVKQVFSSRVTESVHSEMSPNIICIILIRVFTGA